MAEKAGLLQPEAIATLGASSSRESSPEEHSRLAQHSMDSLLLSGESSDDVILDDMEDEEILVSGEDEEEEDEAIVETDAGVLNTMVEEGTDQQRTASGDSTATGPKKVLSSSEGSTTRRKVKRRISRARERKISISSSRLKMEVLKEGYLTQQGSFQRWTKRFMAITADHLYISKEKGDKLREEIILKDVTVAENSTKNINHSFTVLTPFQQVCLAASCRKEMEEWISAFKLAAVKSKHTDVLEPLQHLEGQHSWFACSHGRPTYCNVCGEALHGMAWNGLSCEVCKFKSHRRCVFRVEKPCKWTTRSSLKNDKIQLGQDFNIPHQWIEGNLPTGSKCFVCERACGSVRRLQDFRCLWCKFTVHTECKDKMETVCTLGELRLSILPPSALQRSDAIRDGMWEPYKVYGHSPVLACVNSKSGDNQGVKFIRRLKFWLNPAQVFDLAISGPELGAQLFQRFEKFRVIVLGGDGSIGWVLSTLDKYNLHSKCMVGVVPLGTGNDMARVLGWGATCHDDEKVPAILSEMEQSSFKLMDRWSIQYSPESDLDISSLITALTPIRSGRQSTESVGSSSSPTKPVGIGTRRQPVAPFPGPGTGSSSEQVDQAGGSDGILSPANSVFSSQSSNTSILGDHDHDASHDKSHDTSTSHVFDVEIEITGVEDKEQAEIGNESEENVEVSGNANEQLLNGGSTSKTSELQAKMDQKREEKDGIEEGGERVGSPQDVAKIEAFHNNLAYHFSTILLSEQANEVISSAQVLGQLVREFMTSVIADMGRRLSPSDYQNEPLVQKCSVLQDKLDSLLTNLKEEALNGSKPFSETTPSEPPPRRVEGEDGVGKGSNGNSSTTKSVVKTFKQREALMSRANSLKKAMQGVLDMTEKILDSQDEGTEEEVKEPQRVGGVKDERGRGEEERRTSSESPAGERPMMSLRLPKDSISSVVDIAPLLPDMKQLSCMNNYFGIGLGAKIAYQFGNSRTKSRTKNRMLYLTLGGKEFFANSQRHLERRIQLECDGELVKLPQRLQGVVFLNIPSYMAGTNFWGTEREKDGFSAPSHDDKLVEVVGITGFSHLATAKVLGIQNQRLAQCRFAKINFLGPEKVAVQVDGEAWLQEPGTIVVSHKNKARMLFKSKAFSQSLESWKQKNVHGQHSASCPQLIQGAASPLYDVLSTEELQRYQEVAASAGPLIKCIGKEASVNSDVQNNLAPYATTLTHSRDRVFKEDEVSQTADVEHLQDFEKHVKALLQETHWFLNMHKISSENKRPIREAMNAVETRMRRVLTIDLSSCSQAHHGFRRASDTLILSKPVQPHVKYSPTLTPHRERSVQVIPDATMEGATIAKKIGKEVVQWDIDDVCRWLEELGLGEHCSTFHEQSIIGTKLLGLRKSDLQNLGVVKVGQLTRLWRALQALTGGHSPLVLRTSVSKDSMKISH